MKQLLVVLVVSVGLLPQVVDGAPLNRLTAIYRAAKLLHTEFQGSGPDWMNKTVTAVEIEISIAEDLKLTPAERKTVDAYRAVAEKYREAASAMLGYEAMKKAFAEGDRMIRDMERHFKSPGPSLVATPSGQDKVMEEANKVGVARKEGQVLLKAAEQLYLNEQRAGQSK